MPACQPLPEAGQTNAQAMGAMLSRFISWDGHELPWCVGPHGPRIQYRGYRPRYRFRNVGGYEPYPPVRAQPLVATRHYARHHPGYVWQRSEEHTSELQ